MSSQLPVPSKAAITALRGLVFGTSCTLILITEDRRRRINAARHAIRNAEKIKSAKQYHAGGSVAALTLEDDDSGLILWRNDDGSRAKALRRIAWTEIPPPHSREPQLLSDQKEASLVADPGSTDQLSPRGDRKRGPQMVTPNHSLPDPFIRPLPETPTQIATSPITSRGSKSDSALNSSEIVVNVDELVSKAIECCEGTNILGIEATVTAVSNALRVINTGHPLRDAILETCSRLSILCQEHGRFEDAETILLGLASLGPLNEHVYYECHPVPVIEAIIGRMTSDAAIDHSTHAANLAAASKLFLMSFTEKPKIMTGDLVEAGRQLLDQAFAADNLQLAIDVYWRVIGASDDDYRFVEWFIGRLSEKQEYKHVIKCYLLNYSRMGPDAESLKAVSKLVSDAVAGAHNYKAGQVLRSLMTIQSEFRPDLTTVMRLFYGDWQHYSDFKRSQSLFNELVANEAPPRVGKLQPVFRVMIQISLEAGEHLEAESYFQKAILLDPTSRTDIRILGLFALAEAKAGHWDEVRKLWERMSTRDGKPSQASGDEFVPILKEYARHHTVNETKEFLQTYMEKLGVPICRYMVTRMASEFASIRDVASFAAWLEYCSTAGFAVDATFSNAILTNCWRRWNMPFKALRRIFKVLDDLNPKFINPSVGHIMAEAALSDPSCRGKVAATRLAALKIQSRSLSTRAKYSSQDDVFRAMKEALAVGKPHSALKMYKQAMHRGMPFCRRCLQLAIVAILRQSSRGDADWAGAAKLLQKAQADGGDISLGASTLLLAQMGQVNPKADKNEVYRTLRRQMDHWERNGIEVSGSCLNRAAFACVKAKHFTGAISLTLLASQADGSPTPCHNMYSFSVLLAAYTELVDPKCLRATIDSALTSNFAHEPMVFKQLRVSRRSLANKLQTNESQDCLAAVDGGIRQAIAQRQRRQEEWHQVENAALRIMRQAALDAQVKTLGLASKGDMMLPQDEAWYGGGVDVVKIVEQDVEMSDMDGTLERLPLAAAGGM